MKFITKVFLVCGLTVVACFDSVMAADIVVGPSKACIAHRKHGPNEFYYCGQQDVGCGGVTHNRHYSIDHATYLHGKSAELKVDHNDQQTTRYFTCCGGTGSKPGTWIETSKKISSDSATDWIKETKDVTETFAGGGKCTWQRKINICGTVDNPGDKCTEPNTCTEGYVFVDGKCLIPCNPGYGFDAGGNCIECETSSQQGVVGGKCVRCELNEYFSKEKLQCVSYSTMTQISTMAHEKCWLCSGSQHLKLCMRAVSVNGDLFRPNSSAIASASGQKAVDTSSAEYKAMYENCTIPDGNK